MSTRLFPWLLAAGLLTSSLAAAAPRDVPAGFVTTNGTAFALDGDPFYFQGTNAARFGTTSAENEADVYKAMRAYAAKGLRVVRLWGFSCKGAQWGTPILESANTSGVVYNESAWRRLDATLDAARAVGLKVILPLVNYEPEYCGIDWWAKQIIGSNDRQQFYTDERVQATFRGHVWTLLNRVNTRYQSTLGRSVRYADDPTIMAIEVMNEPHTQDNYEISRGLPPGEIVYRFLNSITAYIRGIDRNHLITSGEEGYKTTIDPVLDTYDNSWVNNGSKGVNFTKNVTISNIDFVTVHVYPDNWAIPANKFEWIDKHFIKRRADIAHAAGKPIILEEAGFSDDASWHPSLGYYQAPAWYLSRMYGFANNAGFAGTLLWQAMPIGFKVGSYDYDFNHPVGDVVVRQAAYMNGRSGFEAPSLPGADAPIGGGGGGSVGSCNNGSASDPDGDGWGWENGKSCRVGQSGGSGGGTCANGNASDPDGDGWGWENGRSCRASGAPRCWNRASDPDGDGWGWENGRSCKI